MQRIGFAALAFALAFLACGAAMASDVERQIPVIRDTAGSGLTMEISREGTRQTATPFLTLHNPTVQEIEDRIVRIVKMTARSAAKEISAGTPRKDAGRPETTLASLPPVSGEITVRSVHGFLKGLRDSRKEKPAPAVVVAVPELRLGRPTPRPVKPTDAARQRYFFRRNRSFFTDATRSRKRIPSRWSISCWIATASNPIDSMIVRSPSRSSASTSTHWARWTLAV